MEVSSLEEEKTEDWSNLTLTCAQQELQTQKIQLLYLLEFNQLVLEKKNNFIVRAFGISTDVRRNILKQNIECMFSQEKRHNFLII